MAITFGRFSDSFKSKPKVDAWAQSEKLFMEKKFLESYKAFIDYIRDDTTNNVSYTRSNGKIDFEFCQGSQKIRGTIGENKILAEAGIAEYEKLSVAFMRRLMEMNYTMYYSRYSLNGN